MNQETEERPNFVVSATMKPATVATIALIVQRPLSTQNPQAVGFVPFIGTQVTGEMLLADLFDKARMVSATILATKPGMKVLIEGDAIRDVARHCVAKFAAHMNGLVIDGSGNRVVKYDRTGDIPSVDAESNGSLRLHHDA